MEQAFPSETKTRILFCPSGVSPGNHTPNPSTGQSAQNPGLWSSGEPWQEILLVHPQSDPKTGTSRRAAKPADEKRRKKHTDEKEIEGDDKRSKDLGPALTLNLSSEPGKLQGQQVLGIGVPHRDHFSSHGKSHLPGCVLALVPFNERVSQYPLTRGAFHRLKSTSDIRDIGNSDPEKQTRESMKMTFPEGGLGAERESSQKVDLKNL